MSRLSDLLDRLLRTESLTTIIGVAIYLSGRVDTWEEAAALAAVVAPLVLGRSAVKMVQPPPLDRRPSER